jgi:transposase
VPTESRADSGGRFGHPATPEPTTTAEPPDRRIAGALLGLADLEPFEVEDGQDAARTVHVVTAADVPRLCTGCGAPAQRPKETVHTAARDVLLGQTRIVLRWHKQRWWCDNPSCAKKTFTEASPQLGPGQRMTARMRTSMAEAVGDQLRPVCEVADTYGCAWHSAHDAFTAHADAVVGPPPREDSEDGADPSPDHDELDGPHDAEHADVQGGRPGAPHDPDPAGISLGPTPLAGGLPPVTVPGVDDTRRGRRRLRRDPDTGAWQVLADQWQTGFVDISGPTGLLGQTPGRTGRDVIRWLTRQPERWRDAVKVVAIDMSGTYRAGIRAALPHAKIAVDPFHIVQAANKMVAVVRRREITRKYRRRGRSGDPEYSVKRLLARNTEDLTPAQAAKLWDTLLAAGQTGERILAAYIAKEKLRDVLALSPTRTGITPADSQIRHRLTNFFDWCADFPNIPEITTLAQTVSNWRHELATAVRTGVSNAKSEGNNRIVKLVARIAFGFRNPLNQRRRVRYAATRADRRHPSQPVSNSQAP